jgi:hypothetical protein
MARYVEADGALAVGHKDLPGPLPLWTGRALHQADCSAPDCSVPVVIIAASAGPGKPTRRVVLLNLHQLPGLVQAAGGAEDGGG